VALTDVAVLNATLAYYVLNEVVITGKLIGQAQALNAQKESPNIRHVASSELFSRFPDVNAAETVQRLPGIAIDRDQGQGEFVHVHGLNAQLNSVTVNGKRIPSPTASLGAGEGGFDGKLLATLDIQVSTLPSRSFATPCRILAS
tara:strand:- start:995 stop:1429 length:435 start_codon:yes stop_codon:yes gene_type:complete